MINFKDITSALETQLKAYTGASSYNITRNKRQNDDDNEAVEGWVGIYRDGVDYSPNSSGPTPWLAEVKIRVEIQSASYESEADCEEKLETLVGFVMNAIDSDRTIGKTVLMVTGLDIDYDDNYAEQMQTAYQFATLIITAEVKA